MSIWGFLGSNTQKQSLWNIGILILVSYFQGRMTRCPKNSSHDVIFLESHFKKSAFWKSWNYSWWKSKKHRLIQLKVGAISASNLNAVLKLNINRLIIGQLNVNSLRDKFESLVQQVTGNIDILMVLEMKLENSFPVSQFLIEDYSLPLRLDRDNNGVNIMIFVREDIACKFLSVQNHPMKGFKEEFNLRKNKWLLCYSYNPIRCIIDFHIVNLNRG